MAYVAAMPERYLGKSVGSGECVALVQAASGVGQAAGWRPGERVKDAGTIARGTIIATFIDGVYPNKSSGNHAAIYLSHSLEGIRVIDQWHGHKTSERLIRYKPGNGDPSNDGDFFYVVE